MNSHAEASSGDIKGSRGEGWTLAATSLPGLVGLALGTIYALGAIETVVQLIAADLKPLALFPLIPLNQVLGRGIVLSITFALITPLTAAMAFLVTYGTPGRSFALVQQLLKIGSRAMIWLLMVVSFAVCLALIALALVKAPWIVWAITPFAFGYFYWFGLYIGSRIGRLRAAALSIVGFVMIAGTIMTLLFPPPLPGAQLHLRGGRVLRGDLVVSTAEAWYLDNGQRVRVVPARSVTEAEVEPKVRPVDDRSLADLLRDALS